MMGEENKAPLLFKAKKVVSTPNYVVQELADWLTDGYGKIKILFLPVTHPDLNHFEMVWGTVQRALAVGNMSFKLSEIEERLKHEIHPYNGERLEPCVEIAKG